MSLNQDLVASLRTQFPALQRTLRGQPVVYFDGPAGTQVPVCVIEEISNYLARHNANHDGQFLTSVESDAMLDEAHRAVSEFLGADDPACVYFGPNMTTLTFALSRSLGRTWSADDEVLVTRLDHDANVTPWVLAARDAGATVRYVEIHHEDCTLDMDDLRSKLSSRTRLVAVGCASNSVGTVNPVREIASLAREVGAVSFLDAVHYAPHAQIDVNSFGCDFLACSAYKFFGPHIGMIWGRRALLEELEPYKVRPAADALPEAWMTGTQNHECIAGVLAAINYLAELGRVASGDETAGRRAALTHAYTAIGEYETELFDVLLRGLMQIDTITVYGITDPSRMSERLPTVSIRHRSISSQELAQKLGNAGIFVWDGNYYALQLTETLGLEPDGMVRIGLVHYNTVEEVHRLLEVLAAIP